MLLVTVGTTDFDDLVHCMDDLAPTLGEEVVSQIGHGHYLPRHCRYFRFAPSLDEHIRQARLVVSHGGQGSILDVVRRGKPLIGVSNPDRRDLHQQDILSKFDADHYILWCRSLDTLADCLARVDTMAFARYVEPVCTIHARIHEYLVGAVR